MPHVARLSATERSALSDRSFAYVDSAGVRRLPIHDEAHVKNALARFNQVAFESEEAKERAQKKLLGAAKKYGIVPVGFMAGQLRSRRSEAAAGRLVIDLDGVASAAELEARLRRELRDPTLSLLQWSESAAAYLAGAGRAVSEANERVIVIVSDEAAHPPANMQERSGEESLLRFVPTVVGPPAI